MITIKNTDISVLIRSPHDDLEQLGSRYCHGGYIWQVYDNAGRPLLSGPRYPNPSPPPFDGQGMPEAFKTPELAQPCRWEIDAGGDYVVMAAKWESMTLSREVRVSGGSIISTTTVRNIGNDEITILWFAHPFFPVNWGLTDESAYLTSANVKLKNDDTDLTSANVKLENSDTYLTSANVKLKNSDIDLTFAKVKSDSYFACGKISPSVILPDNAGYHIDGNGIIRMKPDYPWEKGLFQLLEVPPERLTFDIPHPIVGAVRIITDYEVTRCALWANANTFSFEPFTRRAIKPMEETSWGISYKLGSVAL